MRKTLFDIGSELLALDAVLEELPGGELSPEAEAALAKWMDTLGDEEAAKLDAYLAYLNQLGMEQDRAREESRNWAYRANVRTNRIEWLKANLKLHLERTGREKVMTASGRVVAIQSNGGAAPLVLDPNLNVDEIDQSFVKVVKSVDHAAVRKAIEAGADLPWARLDGRGTHLRVR